MTILSSKHYRKVYCYVSSTDEEEDDHSKASSDEVDASESSSH
jgi:hypothetical protein